MDWAKTTAWRFKKHLSFGIWCDLYKRFYGTRHSHESNFPGSTRDINLWDECENYTSKIPEHLPSCNEFKCCLYFIFVFIVLYVLLNICRGGWGLGAFLRSTFKHVGRSFNLFMASTRDVWKIPSFWIWCYVLHVEHISCFITGWETSARPLANASENLARRVENRPGQVEFCIGYIRNYPFRASAKKI